MNEVSLINNRLKNILINNKRENPNKISLLIKSEIFFVLKNYMDVGIDDINVNIGIDNNGRYLLNINCEINRIYSANYLM